MRVAFLSSLVAFTATTTGTPGPPARWASLTITASHSRYIPAKGREDWLEQASYNQVGFGPVSLLAINTPSDDKF